MSAREGEDGRMDPLLEALRRRLTVAPRRPIGTFDEPEAHAPATPSEIASAEAALGFALPPLLRRLYGEVADGGFGPGYGLFPVHGRRSEPGQDEDLVEVRNKLAVDPRLPPTLLPICDWGCAIWSCLDCSVDAGPIVTLAGEDEELLTSTGHDLRGWLMAWLDGVDLWSEMFEPGPTIVVIHPFTKKPVETKGQGKPRGRLWP